MHDYVQTKYIKMSSLGDQLQYRTVLEMNKLSRTRRVIKVQNDLLQS